MEEHAPCAVAVAPVVTAVRLVQPGQQGVASKRVCETLGFAGYLVRVQPQCLGAGRRRGDQGRRWHGLRGDPGVMGF